MKAEHFFNSKFSVIEASGILAVWLILFMIPVFGNIESGIVAWNEVVLIWIQLVSLLVLFLLNVYLLIPFFSVMFWAAAQVC